MASGRSGEQLTYDDIADFYLAQTGDGAEDPSSRSLLRLAAVESGQRVLDLACAAGRVSRALASLGASVTAVDASTRLLDHAQGVEGRAPAGISYVLGDATTAAWWDGVAFDVVVCNHGLADIRDLERAVVAVATVIKPGGRFVFSLLHLCCPGLGPTTPSAWPPDEGYHREGWWLADNPGMRGKVGSHYRKLSTYLNTLASAGFVLEQADEPDVAPVPLLLAMSWRKDADR